MKFTPIGMKIIKNMLIVITVLGALNVASLYYIKKIDRSYSDLINRRLQIITLLQDLQTEVSEQNSKYRAYLLTENPDYLQQSLQVNVRIVEKVNKAMQFTVLDANKEKLGRIVQDNDSYRQKNSEVLSLFPTDQLQAVNLFDSTMIPLAEEMLELSEDLIQFHLSHMEEGASFNSKIVNKNILISILIMVIDILITIGIIYYYKLKIRLPISPVLTVKK